MKNNAFVVQTGRYPLDSDGGDFLRPIPAGWHQCLIDQYRMRPRATIIAALCLGCVCPAASPDGAKNVIVLLGDDLSLPVVAQYWSAIQSHLKGPDPSAVNIYLESLDVSRFGAADYPPQVAQWYRQKYRSIHPDLIIALAVPALTFLLDRRGDLWRGVPIVAGALTPDQARGIRLPGDVTPVLINLSYERTLNVALTLFPKTRRVVAVSGGAPRDQADVPQLQALDAKTRSRLEWSYLTGLSATELKSKLAALPDQTIVLWTVMTMDGAGRPFIPAFEAVVELSPSSSAPVFGVYPTFVGAGAVGGVLMDPAVSGRQIAETARSVIGLPAPSPQGGADLPTFDWRQLRRWGIAENRLPPGSRILFRQPSLFETHRELVIATSIALLLLSALVVFLLIERRLRATAQAKLKALTEELRRLSGALIAAQEEERTRIARELHDDINQRLALLAIETRQLRQQKGATEIVPQLDEMVAIVTGLSTDVHSLAHGLHPAKLDLLGLLPAVKRHGQEVARMNGMVVDLTAGELPGGVPRDISLCLYRVVQESPANVVRHSGSKHAAVDLRAVNGTIAVTIADDGCGFDPGAVSMDHGMGIVSMRERLRMVNGSISIRPLPFAGTEVKATVALEVVQP